MPTSRNRSFWQRLFGVPATRCPRNNSAWSYQSGQITVNLEDIPELHLPGTGVRLEGKKLGVPVLLLHGDDREFHAYLNRCPHSGKRLDPVPGSGTVQCCGFGKSTYAYDGDCIYGPKSKSPLRSYPVKEQGGILKIDMTGPS